MLKVSATVSANANSFSVCKSSAKINSKILIKTITFCLCSNSSFIWVHILSTLTEFTEVLFFLLSFTLLVPCLSLMNSSNIFRYLTTSSEFRSCFSKISTMFFDESAATISSDSSITLIFATIAKSCIRALRILSLI